MSIDAARSTITDLIKDFHVTTYPGTEVNFPNKLITDVERAEDPFVTIELPMSSKYIGLPSRHCLRVSGQLILNHIGRESIGEKIFNTYSDEALKYFASKALSGIIFYDLTPYEYAGIPGLYGKMNVVEFYKDYFNT